MEQRATRSSRDLSATTIDRLQLPRRGSGRGSRSPSPAAQVGYRASSLVTNHFNFSPATTTATASSTSREHEEENFVDAPSSSATSPKLPNMATLIEPPGEGASIEEIKRYADTLRQQALAFSNSLATTTQLLSQALSTKVSKKRPELPPFDPKNIEAWIRRAENAFTRADITAAKDKFAFLESVISVDLHPSINAYFNGSATQAQYDDFLAFLRKRYGRTKQQKVKAAIEGVRRNGRLPIDLAAMIKEQFDDVTIEDLMRAHFMSEMPQQVRNQLSDRQDDMSLDELAEAANAHFNQDGTLRATNSTVNSVNPCPSLTGVATSQPVNPASYTTAFDSEDFAGQHEVNAINRRGNDSGNASYNSRGSSGGNNGRRPSQSNSRPRYNSPRQGSANRSSSRPGSDRNPAANPNYCWLHNKHGDNANFCKPPCSHPRSQAMVQQQQQSGNGRGGRR